MTGTQGPTANQAGPSPADTEYDIFLSHATPDKTWILGLAERLKALGLRVFVDCLDIRPGDNYVIRLNDALQNIRYLVLVLSAHTGDRPLGNPEWTSWMAGKGPLGRLLPVRIDAVELPALLESTQAIDATDRDAQGTADALFRVVGDTATLAPDDARRLVPGRDLVFTLSREEDRLTVLDPSGAARQAPLPWNQDRQFAIAHPGFSKLHERPVTEAAARAEFHRHTRTLGSALFQTLFDTARAKRRDKLMGPDRPRPVVQIRSDDAVVLALPRGAAPSGQQLPGARRADRPAAHHRRRGRTGARAQGAKRALQAGGQRQRPRRLPPALRGRELPHHPMVPRPAAPERPGPRPARGPARRPPAGGGVRQRPAGRCPDQEARHPRGMVSAGAAIRGGPRTGVGDPDGPGPAPGRREAPGQLAAAGHLGAGAGCAGTTVPVPDDGAAPTGAVGPAGRGGRAAGDGPGDTASRLRETSLLEQMEVLAPVDKDRLENVTRYSPHPATVRFVQEAHPDDPDDPAIILAAHRRLGAHWEAAAKDSPDIQTDIEADHHMFQAGEYDRACELPGTASGWLQNRGWVREGLAVLAPFLEARVRSRMDQTALGTDQGGVLARNLRRREAIRKPSQARRAGSTPWTRTGRKGDGRSRRPCRR